MQWQTPVVSDALLTNSAYQTVQQGGGDMIITLNPDEMLRAIFAYTEGANYDCQVVISTTVTGGAYTSDGHSPIVYLRRGQSVDAGVPVAARTITGVQLVRFRARTIDTDGTAGGLEGSLIISVSKGTQ